MFFSLLMALSSSVINSADADADADADHGYNYRTFNIDGNPGYGNIQDSYNLDLVMCLSGN